MSHAASPFLAVPRESRIAENDLAFAIYDANPVSPGHTLIIPVRPIVVWFDATREEWAAALDLVGDVKALLDSKFRPDGYNVGFNAGRAAGQTVFHAHLHVIPRHDGDVEDPTGGVRHAVVGRGHY
ncbi:HIT family protein [Isoptericola sp. NPDC019693]|uniref:HIT family protein n=1 Tax=Isoptericola sp. NPDC019693 TaxID=3364009 RepID=UPI00379BE2BB